MADFRKALYAFALVALIVGITVPASAQSSPTCTVGAVPTQMRSESYTDLMGDIVLTCTGGLPTAAGLPVPAITFTVSTSGIITSKITDATPTGNPTAFTEALLIIDGPNTKPTVALPSNPVLACGTPVTAPYDTNAGGTNLGVCTIAATGAGGGSATGTTYNGAAGHPNVFQGRLLPNSGGTGIQFIGVPFDPPAGTETLVIRITNIRINSVAISGGSVVSGGFNSNQVQSQVSITTPTSVSLPNITVTTGLIRNGLLYPPTTRSVGPYPQCGPIPSDGGAVNITEGFASSFKTKNWAAMQANGVANAGGTDLVYNNTVIVPAVDLNQNVPGALYSTESGFEFQRTPALGDPTPNAPLGRVAQGQAVATSVPFPTGLQTGIDQAGTVTNGTRLAFVFANIPIGSNATVPTAIPLKNAQIGSGFPQTGIMVAVTGFDANGAGGTLTATGVIALSETANTTVVYEVLFADQNTIESAVVPVTIAPTINLGANPPVNGSPQISVIASASAGFAPFYAPGFSPNPGISEPMSATTTATSLPIARFINNQTAAGNLFSFTKCACDLLFPWVVGDNTFTTSIVVDNVSKDPGPTFAFPLAASQTGRVTFWYYGTKGIDVSGANLVDATYVAQQTNVLIPPGSYVATVVSPSAAGDTPTNGLKRLPGNFAGYVISQSEFRFCHGVAAITSSLPGFGTQTYIGLVMDNDQSYNLLTPAGAVFGTAVRSGQLPRRTTNLGENFDQ